MIDTTDMKKGVKLELEGKVFVIVKSDHTNPGKGSAFIKTKLKNLKTGAVLERTFKTGVATGATIPDLTERQVEFMYLDKESFYFLDQNNFETIQVSTESIGNSQNFLQEGIKLTLLFYKNAPISIELPTFVNLRVEETDPGLKGDTASGGQKKALMNTGARINIPLFIKKGELLKIDTRTGEYVERVKN